MRILIMLAVCFSLVACIEEESYCDTGEVDYFKTEETEFYTITVPVYKKVKC